MEFKQVLAQRYSCRRYLDRPVNPQAVEQLAARCQRVPSWGNTQPWRIYAAGGDTARAIRRDLKAAHLAGEDPRPDIAMPTPTSFVPRLLERYKTLGRTHFKAMGIGREDADKRASHYANNYDAFRAPALVFFTVPQGQTSYVIMDTGAAVTAFCLAAADEGLGTVILAALARYPDLVRRHLPIPDDEKLVIGLALGHPDTTDDEANRFRSHRAELDEVLTLTGF